MMIFSLLGKDNCNIEVLKAMVRDECWGRADESQWLYGMTSQLDTVVKGLIEDNEFWRKVKVLHSLFDVLSKFVHFLETPGCRASFLYPLFVALIMDVNNWADLKGDTFEDDTVNKVKAAVENRWTAAGRIQAGLYSKQYLMAMMVDPGMCVEQEYLADNWKTECQKIINRFYSSSSDRREAMTELECIVLRQGVFGAEVEEHQQAIDKQAKEGGSKPASSSIGHVEWEIRRMQAALERTRPANSWRTAIAKDSPKLSDLACRLLEMGTQSADVERVCKAHKLVHTKVRNRLANKKVNMLLYCYVNLRLLNRYEEQGRRVSSEPDITEEFLQQAILDESEESGAEGSSTPADGTTAAAAAAAPEAASDP